MQLKMQIKTLGFLYNLVKGSDTCRLPAGKPLFEAVSPSGIFPEALPEQEGVRSEGLLKMFTEMSDDRRINPHSAVVLRNGKLISSADWAPFSAEYPHVSHSLAKSVTSMAVGIAVKEKYLDTDERLSDIFGSTGKVSDNVTIRHLLTMSSGVKFNEASSLISGNWAESFLSSDTFFEAGTSFLYNSMNTYMLSAALCKRTGLSLSEYLSRRLFRPIGIENFYWEKCPNGIEKGGWGLYMTVYDYARLGQLWLQNGLWNGVQLIPEEWISAASSIQISHNKFCSDGYGFQVWHGKHGIIFNGMFGQFVYIAPKHNIVIAVTAGSEGLFPCGGTLEYIENFLGNSENFSSSPITHFHYADAAALRKALSSAQFASPLKVGARKSIFSRLKERFTKNTDTPEDILNGVSVIFDSNRADLLPLLIQIMEGCFGQGIEKVEFTLSEESFTAVFHTGDTTATLPLSFKHPIYFSHRNYNAASTAVFTTDEDDYPVIKIQLCYLETSCTKVLKFIFTEKGVTLKIRESPQLYSALDEISELTSANMGENIRKALGNILESDAASYKIKSFIEPTLQGKYEL